MNSRVAFLLFILFATALEVSADILFKKWALGGRGLIFFLGLGMYSIGTVFWGFSLKYEFLSKAISVFTVLNMLIIVLVGAIFFNENLTLANKLGILIGLASLILVQI